MRWLSLIAISSQAFSQPACMTMLSLLQVIPVCMGHVMYISCMYMSQVENPL